VNAVSPEAATNADFTEALALALSRPAFLPVPCFAVKLAFGEMGREALLASTRVQPARLLERGFAFNSPGLDAALKQTLGRPNS
jgi:NAD dependent epimerase/dehydratase family enzyme